MYYAFHKCTCTIDCIWIIHSLFMLIACIGIFIGCLGICFGSFTGRIAYDVSIHNNTIINDESYRTLILAHNHSFDKTRIGCKTQYVTDVTTYSSYWQHICVSPISTDSVVNLWITRTENSYTESIPPNVYVPSLIGAITRIGYDDFFHEAIRHACKHGCGSNSTHAPIFVENKSAYHTEAYQTTSNTGWIIMGIFLLLSIILHISIVLLKYRQSTYIKL